MIILIAEDEALIALVLKLALRAVGHRVLGPVDTADEALRLAATMRPEFALVDINLKHHGEGIQLARALRDRYGTPCLFLSGQISEARANRDAACGIIAKPYDPTVVLRAIEVVDQLRHGRVPQQVPPQLELFH